jgi:rare lipoprotein A
MNVRLDEQNTSELNLKRHCALMLLCLLAGCSSGPQTPGISVAGRPPLSDGAPLRIPPNLDAVPDAVPRYEPRTRAGNPENYEVFGTRYYVLKESSNYLVRGIASWYGSKFHGLKTSNGEAYDMFAMSAAHKTLPIPCYARVTNLENGRSITVRINDRGPFVDERVIDLSYTAAYKLRMLEKGTAFVEVRTVEPGQPLPPLRTAANETTAATPLTSERKNDTREQIFIQVGAFSNPSNAQKLQAELASRQLAQSQVRTVEHQGGRLYRVQLGPVPGIAQANILAGRLGEIGFSNTHFVIEKNNLDQPVLQ